MYSNYEKLMFVSPAPHRIKCECGWYNNPPSKKNESVARCKKCGSLINRRERFKEELLKTQKREEGK